MPYAAYVGVVTGCVVLIFIGFDVFVPFSVQGFITSYFGIAFAAFVFVLWKVLKRTSFIQPRNADIWSGKAEVDAECSIWEVEGKDVPVTAIGRFWDKLW